MMRLAAVFLAAATAAGAAKTGPCPKNGEKSYEPSISPAPAPTVTAIEYDCVNGFWDAVACWNAGQTIAPGSDYTVDAGKYSFTFSCMKKGNVVSGEPKACLVPTSGETLAPGAGPKKFGAKTFECSLDKGIISMKQIEDTQCKQGSVTIEKNKEEKVGAFRYRCFIRGGSASSEVSGCYSGDTLIPVDRSAPISDTQLARCEQGDRKDQGKLLVVTKKACDNGFFPGDDRVTTGADGTSQVVEECRVVDWATGRVEAKTVGCSVEVEGKKRRVRLNAAFELSAESFGFCDGQGAVVPIAFEDALCLDPVIPSDLSTLCGMAILSSCDNPLGGYYAECRWDAGEGKAKAVVTGCTGLDPDTKNQIKVNKNAKNPARYSASEPTAALGQASKCVQDASGEWALEVLSESEWKQWKSAGTGDNGGVGGNSGSGGDPQPPAPPPPKLPMCPSVDGKPAEEPVGPCGDKGMCPQGTVCSDDNVCCDAPKPPPGPPGPGPQPPKPQCPNGLMASDMTCGSDMPCKRGYQCHSGVCCEEPKRPCPMRQCEDLDSMCGKLESQLKGWCSNTVREHQVHRKMDAISKAMSAIPSDMWNSGMMAMVGRRDKRHAGYAPANWLGVLSQGTADKLGYGRQWRELKYGKGYGKDEEDEDEDWGCDSEEDSGRRSRERSSSWESSSSESSEEWVMSSTAAPYIPYMPYKPYKPYKPYQPYQPYVPPYQPYVPRQRPQPSTQQPWWMTSKKYTTMPPPPPPGLDIMCVDTCYAMFMFNVKMDIVRTTRAVCPKACGACSDGQDEMFDCAENADNPRRNILTATCDAVPCNGTAGTDFAKPMCPWADRCTSQCHMLEPDMIVNEKKRSAFVAAKKLKAELDQSYCPDSCASSFASSTKGMAFDAAPRPSAVEQMVMRKKAVLNSVRTFLLNPELKNAESRKLPQLADEQRKAMLPDGRAFEGLAEPAPTMSPRQALMKKILKERKEKYTREAKRAAILAKLRRRG